MTHLTATLPATVRAEVRFVESGRVARVDADGAILVKSDTRDGLTHRVTFAPGTGGHIEFACGCEGARHGHFCRHMAAAARRLEREHLAEYRAGSWWLPARLAAPAAPVAPVNVRGLVD